MIKHNLQQSLREIFAYFHIGHTPDQYLDELEADTDFLSAIEARVANVPEFRTKRFESIYQLGKAFKIVQYALVRALRPQCCVETGVLHGLSTSFILNALSKNGGGQLISIDRPAHETWTDRAVSESGMVDTDNLPRHSNLPGWVIPDPLRPYWTLELGLSSELLPLVLDRHTCDYFVHDSEHTYANMTFELELAWEKFHGPGAIVCDNIDWSAAFQDFADKHHLRPLFITEEGEISVKNQRFGLVRHPG